MLIVSDTNLNHQNKINKSYFNQGNCMLRLICIYFPIYYDKDLFQKFDIILYTEVVSKSINK